MRTPGAAPSRFTLGIQQYVLHVAIRNRNRVWNTEVPPLLLKCNRPPKPHRLSLRSMVGLTLETWSPGVGIGIRVDVGSVYVHVDVGSVYFRVDVGWRGCGGCSMDALWQEWECWAPSLETHTNDFFSRGRDSRCLGDVFTFPLWS